MARRPELIIQWVCGRPTTRELAARQIRGSHLPWVCEIRRNAHGELAPSEVEGKRYSPWLASLRLGREVARKIRVRPAYGVI